MGEFIPTYSTDHIWREENMERCLSTDLNSIESIIAALQTLVGDTSVSSQITAAITAKVDKVDGKDLSSNDYTDAEKTKLAGIAEGANNYVLPIATSSELGGIKVGDNITNTAGVISLSEDNIISALDVLPRPQGGTGVTYRNAAVNLTHENVVSTSSSSCVYFPYLGMCWLRAYVVLSEDLAANTALEVINVDNAYRPSSITALSAWSNTSMMSAQIRKDSADETAPAVIRIKSDVALSSGASIYISGWWVASYM